MIQNNQIARKQRKFVPCIAKITIFKSKSTYLDCLYFSSNPIAPIHICGEVDGDNNFKMKTKHKTLRRPLESTHEMCTSQPPTKGPRPWQLTLSDIKLYLAERSQHNATIHIIKAENSLRIRAAEAKLKDAQQALSLLIDSPGSSHSFDTLSKQKVAAYQVLRAYLALKATKREARRKIWWSLDRRLRALERIVALERARRKCHAVKRTGYEDSFDSSDAENMMV